MEYFVIVLWIKLLIVAQLASSVEYFTNQWAVEIDGGDEDARRLADQFGFVYVDRIMPGFYHLQHRKVSKRSLQSSDHHYSQLVSHPNVKWVEQQVIKRRTKRDPYSSMFNDPYWPNMWYMHREDGNDMQVAEVYRRFNITGKGVYVSILDDGIEKDHPDLMKNYDPTSSYDVNGHDSDPQPRYDYSNENRHGTRCAGEVSAQADNHICNVGIAYDAGIGGVRMLDGDVTDAVEAQSLSLNPQHIDIYSASWGPDDDGRTVDGPGPLAKKAFFDGIMTGRRGLGNIYVWASGNGGRMGDSCACDGYTNSIFTLSISSSSENGRVPWYSESCASTLATTYSSGAQGEKQILTTDLRKGCTEQHTGTSASAPLAAGICALALQANKNLTWRDLQHIVVLTARQANLVADDWITNGIGKRVSHHYGFGLMNAAAMVELALKWTTVPDQHRCPSMESNDDSRAIPASGHSEFTIHTDGCHGTNNEINFLEHVEAVITLTATRRGEVEIYLTSPAGTKSTLLGRRSSDASVEGFNSWTFMTTHCWGESPTGNWKLEVKNSGTTSVLSKWSVILYGTKSQPGAYTSAPPMTSSSRPATSSSVSLSHRSEHAGIVNSSEDDIEIKARRLNSTWLCPPGQYQLNETCFTDCPIGYFSHNYTNTSSLSTRSPRLDCLPCHPECNRCNGSDRDSCLKCGSDKDRICKQTYKHREIKIVAIVAVLCLLLVTVLVCVVVHIRVYRNGQTQKKNLVMMSFRADNHIPIGMIDTIRSDKKPLLESDSESDSDEYYGQQIEKH